MIHAATTGHPHARFADERKQYRQLYALAFVLVLTVAVVARALPRTWRPFKAANGRRRSILAEVSETVDAIMPFAFMH